MRNIKRMILWGLPPSFCALVQRAGRVARDFQMLGKAILIVPAATISKGVTEVEVELALKDHIGDNSQSAEAENRGEEEVETLANNGIQLASGNEMVHVDDGGIRVAHDSDDDEEEEERKEVTKKRKKKIAKDFNSREAHFLSLFVGTTKCRRLVWDDFFANHKKCMSRSMCS